MTVRIPVQHLHQFTARLLTAAGVTPEKADIAAGVLTYADRHGFVTHGLNAAVNMYVPWLRSGRVDGKAAPRVVTETPAITVLDCADGLGVIGMTEAVDRAAAAARRVGVGVVAVRRSTHFGAAGYYSHRLATAGLVGLVMTNCGAQGVVPPLGGTQRMLGTNPLAAAVPGGRMSPFVLDMSTTVAATGRIKQARNQGQEVPSGWLIGRDGSDVTDPEAYYTGAADVAWLGGRLETGGAKGYGLALLVDLLCGPLAGAAYGPHQAALDATEPLEDRDVGHFAIALDPAAFGDPAAIGSNVDELLQTVSVCPPVAYADAVTYPGAPEAGHAERADTAGVPLSEAVAVNAATLARELGVTVPAELTTIEPGVKA